MLTVTISNKEEKPAEKTQKLYFLSEEASRKHEIIEYFERKVALSGENLADYLLSDDILNKIRIALKKGTGQKLNNHDIAKALVEQIFVDDLVTEDTYKKLSKIKRNNK